MSTVLMGVLWLTFSNCCSFNHFYYLWLKFCFHFSSDQLGTCPCLCVCVCVHILKDYVIVCDFSDPWLLGLTSSCSEWRSECSPSRGRAGCELAPADRFHESPVSSCPSHPLAQPLHEHTSLMPPSTVSSAFHKKSLLHIRVWVFFFFAHFQCVCSSFKCEGAHHPCRVYSTLKKFEVCVRISRAYGRTFSVHVREMHKQNTHVLSIYWKSNNKAYAHTHRSTVTLKLKVLKTSYAFG